MCITQTSVPMCYSFEVGDCLEPFYTGGVVQCSEDGQHMFCTCGSAVKVVQVETGRVEHSIEEVSLGVIGSLCVIFLQDCCLCIIIGVGQCDLLCCQLG